VRERRYIGPEEVVEAGLLHDPAAEAAAAADDEVPGEAIDQQALEEAEAAAAETPEPSDAEETPEAEETAEVEAAAEAEAAAAADEPATEDEPASDEESK